MNITFIGGGNMGEAILAAVLSNRLAKPADIVLSDIKSDRLDYIAAKYNVTTTSDNLQAVNRADVILLAIKPQNLVTVMTGLSGQIKPSQCILSIIAGARINSLCLGMNTNCVVRAMPNTPAQIGEGITVWTATPYVSQPQKAAVSAILGVMGKEIYVDNEKYMDMVTAVSGSGPAYLFLYIESMVAAGIQIGLPENIVQTLVLQTITGSAHLLEKSGKQPAELRQMVTSPGGTTAEAIAEFNRSGFSEMVKRAVTAAYNRAQQLGG
jgi:pyrroline-5-carboxylate reductase